MRYSTFDSYFYPHSNVLRNNLNIHNPILLEQKANVFATVGLSECMQKSVPVHFDANYLKFVHRTILGDVYDWAGQYRTCEMARNQDFCPPDRIAGEVQRFCERFRGDFLIRKFQDKSGAADVVSEAWGRLNAIHPFRDGNGRSQFVFFAQACRSQGFDLVPSAQVLRDLRPARDLASAGNPRLLASFISRSLVERPTGQTGRRDVEAELFEANNVERQPEF